MKAKSIALPFLFLITLTVSVSAQNTSVTQVNENVRIDSYSFDGKTATVIVSADIAQQATFVDMGAFTGSGVSKVRPKRVTLTPDRPTNITIETTASGLGRGVVMSTRNSIVPIKDRSGALLPEPQKQHIIYGVLSSGTFVFFMMFLWVRRQKSKTEKSLRQVA